MKIIRTREDLLAVALDFAPTNACMTAIRQDRVLVLGAFKFPDGFSGWVLEVRTVDHLWIIQIVGDEGTRTYRASYPKDVPWEGYIGTPGGPSGIINGDDPLAWAERAW